MGRSIGQPSSGGSSVNVTYAGGDGIGLLLPGQLPTFGSGRFQVLSASGDFQVPPGVTLVRARVHAGGGGQAVAGGSSSFGSLLSATGGGKPTGAVPGVGGQGFGGDFQASGGAGGANYCGGGGAMGSELGVGGAGGAGGVSSGQGVGGGGGAVGGMVGGAATGSVAGGGASPFQAGRPGQPARDLTSLGFMRNAMEFIEYWPGFAFVGGGTDAALNHLTFQISGSGAGGGGGSNGWALHANFGGVGGGGGGGVGPGSDNKDGGQGGWATTNRRLPETGTFNLAYDINQQPRLIGGGRGGNNAYAGAGGGGYARGVFAVTPGQIIPVTVAQQVFAGVFVPETIRFTGMTVNDRSGGLVVVEY